MPKNQHFLIGWSRLQGKYGGMDGREVDITHELYPLCKRIKRRKLYENHRKLDIIFK